MLVARDFDIEDVVYRVCGLAAGLLDEERDRDAFVQQGEAGGVRDRVKHAVHALLLDEELIDIKCSASGVPQAEAGHDVFLVDLPETRVVVHALRGDAEKLSLRSKLDFRVRHDPLLL